MKRNYFTMLHSHTKTQNVTFSCGESKVKGQKPYIFITALFLLFAAFQGIAQTTVTIGTGNQSNNDVRDYGPPFTRYYNYSAGEMLYLNTEIGQTGIINKLAFQKKAGDNVNQIRSVDIYLKTTAATTLGTTTATGYTLVYSGSFTNDATTGWMEVTLNTPFIYSDNTQNLSVLVVKGFQNYITNAGGRPRYNVFDATGRATRYYDDYDEWTPASEMEATGDLPKIRFVMGDLPSCLPLTGLNASPTSLTAVNVSWTAGTGSVGYEYAVTTNATPPATGTETTATTATGIAMTPDTTNYLHVRSNCGEADGYSTWTTYSFYGGYCLPTNTLATNRYITGVSTTGAEVNFSNTGTGFSQYTNYTSTYSVTTFAGGSIGITATHPNGSYVYRVWVDWNNDLDFDDPGETVITSTYTTSPVAVGTIVVPLGTPDGTYRMRIRNSWQNSPPPACGNYQYGEAEDYSIIVSTPTCFTPYALAITPEGPTTTTLSWSPPEIGTFPQGYEYVLSTSPDVPTGSGTPTGLFYLTDVTYNPAVSVYLFVRSHCGGDDYSAWTSTAILNTKTQQLPKNAITVYTEGNAININSDTIDMTAVNIFDARGRKLYSKSINGAKVTISDFEMQQQLLIIQVETAKGTVSKKVVF
ncbi:T9SS sorting signal type C domain-containing protein [Flavobacterium sp. Sd200]|uniref:GEVED domain-containing protein n=1 Tax=Flavobacterium sp. Sd200 TaxID=2692211 RepID=UPI00136FD863|nr:GEVED domain-containing protein [Flavobacterium sp. Sd200]MXN92724.1 T9SS sorting signal type C domain-containing protein [Flavobacterium sp. Sd200]